MNLQQISLIENGAFSTVNTDTPPMKKKRPNHLVIETTITMSPSLEIVVEQVGSPIFLSKESSSETIQKAYEKLLQSITDFQAKDVKIFLDRGGKIDILGNSTISINKGHYFTGCSGGVNRSQATSAYLEEKGGQVQGIFSGAILNDETGSFADYNMSNLAFEETFKCKKRQQIGAEVEKKDRPIYFKKMFETMSPITFICFAECSSNIIKRLIERKNEDLTGFRIIHLPWSDEIQEPSCGIPKGSLKAHQLFQQKLEKYLVVK